MVSCGGDPDSIPVKHPSVINTSCKLLLNLHIQMSSINLQTPIIYPSVVFFSIRIVSIKLMQVVWKEIEAVVWEEKDSKYSFTNFMSPLCRKSQGNFKQYTIPCPTKNLTLLFWWNIWGSKENTTLR